MWCNNGVTFSWLCHQLSLCCIYFYSTFLLTGHRGLLLLSNPFQQLRWAFPSNNHCIHGGKPLLRCHGWGTSSASFFLIFLSSDYWIISVETDIIFMHVYVNQVQDSSDVIKDGRVRVVFGVPPEPQLESLIQNQHVRNSALTCCQLRNLLACWTPFVILMFWAFGVSSEILCQIQSRVCAGVSSWHQ